MNARLQWQLALVASKHDAAAKLVGLTLAMHMDADGGSCWPSKDTISGETSLDVRTVDHAIRRLETARWLRVARTRGRYSNRYQAVIPNPGTQPGSTPERRQGSTPAQNHPNPGADDISTPALMPPELVLNPPMNRSRESALQDDTLEPTNDRLPYMAHIAGQSEDEALLTLRGFIGDEALIQAHLDAHAKETS